ncbi:MAG TPA: beta-galactosidase, partial [Chloroflexota bacterium]
MRDRLLTAAVPLLLLSCVLATTLVAGIPVTTARAQTAPQHHVTWDEHSLLLDGRRLLLYSGEFQYFRLPSQSQWLDRLQKIKAAGLNAVSLYFDWQYHSPAPGQYDFSGIRDIDALLAMCQRLGLYVIARVGPYMNAEVDAGGLPGWLLRQTLYPRSQTWNGTTAQPDYSALYMQYSSEWYDHLLPILARHQVTSGGPVILLSVENEYNQSTGSQQYMQNLYDLARRNGIDVPIFDNDFYFNGSWSQLVDLYGYDSYPYGFQCCHQWWDEHFHGVDTWETTLRSQLHITTPMFVAELQGGAYDPWGGKGYKAIATTLGPDWLSALDESALAQGTSVLNTYMFAGGTTWGYMGEPGVYTSYDYGAPIAESGALRPAYYAAHRIALYLQSFGEALAGADAAPQVVTATNPVVTVHSRVDASSGTAFTFLRHGDAGDPVQTKLQINVAGHQWLVPQRQGSFITVPGHGTSLLLENRDVGPLHLNYTTSQVLTDATTAEGHFLVLYGPQDSSGETDFALPAGDATVVHNANVSVTRTNGELRLNYRHTTEPRTISISTPSGVLRVLITDTSQASHYWEADNMLISGPDLVEAKGGSAITLYNNARHSVRAYGSLTGTDLKIDGKVTAEPDPYMDETLLGNLVGTGQKLVPALSSWKFAPESPEISPTFDDSSWTVADHSTTSNPNVPAASGLLADDYGFHYGYVWYRGHFVGSGKETTFSLEARQSYDVYLNGALLGTGDTSLADPPHPYGQLVQYSIPAGLVRQGADNVVSVLTESLGHDEGWLAGPLAQSPQGILAAQLDSGATITWRIQGALGGESGSDPVRGAQNASGLYGERQGWYLPSFDDSKWQMVTLPDTWTKRGVNAAIGWYRTSFSVNLPRNESDPLGLAIPAVSSKATIWLNGWLVGRYWQQLGPQHVFYLPQGLLNPNGTNELAIAVWSHGSVGGLTSVPHLSFYPELRRHQLNLAGNAELQDGFWHTAGNRIVDVRGRPVRIAAVNWGGMQNYNYVPAGLDTRPLDDIMSTIAGLGFNTIRLPFSNQLVELNPILSKGLAANPALQGLHALDVMDRIVQSARAHGLRIILEDHRSTVGTDPQENGLWYTAKYPETAWLRDWKLLAARYKGDSTVVGVDLRNEPHTGPPGPWSVKTYLNQGATWGPYHGVENPRT